MSRRKYDHLRFRINDDKRLLDLIRKYPSAEPTEEAIFGENSPEVTAYFDERDARLERRKCSNGNCSVMWDPKRKQAAYSLGPAGCCDE